MDRSHVTQAAPETRTQIKRWIERVLDQRRWNPAELARQSGVSPSTIGRALDDDAKFAMTIPVLAKLAGAARMSLPPEIIGTAAPARQGPGDGLAEPDAVPYQGPGDAGLEQADNLDNWQIRGRGLELGGYLPGDIVQVARTTVPRLGDVVLAQVYDSGGAETVFRLYDPPYLVTRTADPAAQRKPLLVDGERVVIVGVVHKLVRLRG